MSRGEISIDNPTLELGKVDPFINENGEWGIKNRLKRMNQKGELDMDEMYNILGEEKPNQREQIKIQWEI